MPRAPDGYHQLVRYCSRGARRELEAERGSAYTRLELLNIARNVAEAFQWVHEQHCLVGDVNHTNILVDRDTGSVFLIDVDSFQVTDERTGVTHRCDVGKDEFTPPHLLNRQLGSVDRTPDDDGFGLAILIFEILMDGVHPYDAVNTSAQGPSGNQRLRNISQGRSPYAAILENFGDAWLEAARVGDQRSRQLVQEMAFEFIRRVSGTGNGTAVERLESGHASTWNPGSSDCSERRFPTRGPAPPHIAPLPETGLCDPGSGDGDCTVTDASVEVAGYDFRTSSPRRSGCRPSHRVPDWYHRRRGRRRLELLLRRRGPGCRHVVGSASRSSARTRRGPSSGGPVSNAGSAASSQTLTARSSCNATSCAPCLLRTQDAGNGTGGSSRCQPGRCHRTLLRFPSRQSKGHRNARRQSAPPQVGETLSVSTSDILDEDGLTGASFYYQWLVNDGSSDRLIPGADGSNYTIRPDDIARTLQVTVGFADDKGNAEFLFSDRTGPVPGSRIDERAIATVTLFGGASGVLEVAWSQPPETPRDYRVNWARTDQDYPTWQDPDGNAFPVIPTYTITGLEPGRTYRVRVRARYENGPGEWSDQFEALLAAELTEQPTGGTLPIPVKTGDSEKIPVIATGMPDSSPTLIGELRDGPLAHNGVDAFTFRASFSEPIAIGYKAFGDHSFDVTGGSVTRARRVNGRSDLWEITVKPSAATAVSVALASGRACDERGAICTKDGRPLTDGPLELIVAGPDG